MSTAKKFGANGGTLIKGREVGTKIGFKFFNVQVDALFVTAVLTVIGASVHDTIVVFDRVRENLKYY